MYQHLHCIQRAPVCEILSQYLPVHLSIFKLYLNIININCRHVFALRVYDLTRVYQICPFPRAACSTPSDISCACITFNYIRDKIASTFFLLNNKVKTRCICETPCQEEKEPRKLFLIQGKQSRSPT